jgi:hypothetical protein
VAIFTFSTFRNVQGYDMVTGLQALDSGPTLEYFATSLMAQDCRKSTFRIIPRQGKSIGMTNTGSDNLE